jgi:hypothetical protein
MQSVTLDNTVVMMPGMLVTIFVNPDCSDMWDFDAYDFH